jgi:hypothetical protein
MKIQSPSFYKLKGDNYEELNKIDFNEHYLKNNFCVDIVFAPENKLSLIWLIKIFIFDAVYKSVYCCHYNITTGTTTEYLNFSKYEGKCEFNINNDIYFNYDYDKIKETNKRKNEEIIKKVFHPSRIAKWEKELDE